MSVPRDTVVLNGSGGIMKINSVYAGGGADGMARLSKRLGAMLGFELDGYVLVNLKAFRETVDLVDGVEFDVPQDMYYNDPSQDLYINLKAGKQTLDGEKAMELVRFRKGYASQDIQRTKVQQEFLRALAKKVLSVSSLTKLKDFADVFSTYVTTDLTVGNMLYFAQSLMKCDFDAMKTYTLEGEGAMINGVSYYPLYAGKLVQVVNESFNPYDAPVTLDTVNVITPDLARSYQKQTAPEPEDSRKIRRSRCRKTRTKKPRRTRTRKIRTTRRIPTKHRRRIRKTRSPESRKFRRTIGSARGISGRTNSRRRRCPEKKGRKA